MPFHNTHCVYPDHGDLAAHHQTIHSPNIAWRTREIRQKNDCLKKLEDWCGASFVSSMTIGESQT